MTEEILRRLLGLEARQARFENGVQVDQNIVRIGGDLEVSGTIAQHALDITPFLMLPGLRGLWTFSSVFETGNVQDLSGQGRALTNTGAATFGTAGLIPYADLNGSSQWLYRPDEAGLDITGPMTVLSWVRFNSPGVNSACISKYTAAGGQISWLLQNVSGDPGFYVSGDGAALVSKTVQGVGITSSKFVFIAGRFTPSTEIAVFGNDKKAMETVGVPAALFNSNATAPLMFGARNFGAPDRLLNGNLAICALCAAAHSDTIINNLFNQSRGAFGV